MRLTQAANLTTGRVLAIDLARFLAILGMMAAHLLAHDLDVVWLTVMTSGFPSTLFAVLGGFGVVFSSRRYLADGARKAALVAGFVRGAAVVGVGLVLEVLPPHPIAIVLVYYGVAIMAASLLVLLSQRALILTLAASAIIVPLIGAAATQYTPDFATHGSLDYSSLGPLVLTVFLTGTYPALTWTVYLGAGIVLARSLMRSPKPVVTAAMWGTGSLLLAVGADLVSRWRVAHAAEEIATWAVGTSEEIREYLNSNMYGTAYTGGWDALLIASPHSGSTMDILRTGGASFALICGLILITAPLRATPLLLNPIAKIGSAPLTTYSLHVVMTAYTLMLFWDSQSPRSIMWELLSHAFLWQLLVIFALGVYLCVTNKRGPLETAVSAVSKRAARSSMK